MAVSFLPGFTSPCFENCRGNYAVELRTSVSSSLASAAVSEAGPSLPNFPLSGSKTPIPTSPSSRSFCCQAGTTHVNGRLPRLPCRSRSHVQNSGGSIIRWNCERGIRLKASATKDSEQDVFLRTNSHGSQEASFQRLRTPTSSNAEDPPETEKEDREQDISGSQTEGENQSVLETVSESSTSERLNSSNDNDTQGIGLQNSAALGTAAAGLGLIVALCGFGTASLLYKDQINEFLIQLSDFIEGYGTAGYGVFVLVYAGLELLAIPAIPLTMSAGLLFGTVEGTIIVSIAGTIAATGAFLIARYLARSRLLELAKDNKKFLAIDKAIGDDGFRVVTLLRLSPLLPFSLGNYLYGLTSVKLGPYILGSWLGMLPGSWAYVSAGAISRTFITKQDSEPFFTGGPDQLWTLGVGLAVTIFAATYVTGVAKEALKDIDD